MTNPNNSVTGGDLDANAYRASVSGEESVGGTASVPGQNDTEDMAIAVGITIPDESPLHFKEMMQDRDLDRWELDPESVQIESKTSPNGDPNIEILESKHQL